MSSENGRFLVLCQISSHLNHNDCLFPGGDLAFAMISVAGTDDFFSLVTRLSEQEIK